MSKTSSFLLAAVVSVFVLVVTGCAPREVGEVARASQVWVDAPRDGVRVPEPTPLPVMAHGAMPDGVREMELLVNGRRAGQLAVVTRADGLQEGRARWTPPGKGIYRLQVRAIGFSGRVVTSRAIRVLVGEGFGERPPETATPTAAVESPTFTPSPQATVTPTELVAVATLAVSPTSTFTPTPTPTLTPTPTPRPPTPTPTPTPRPPTPTPTPTPWPAAQVNFWADKTLLVQGECTILHWDVEYATAVYLNGEGVVGHDTRQVCPPTTTTYTLHVEAPSGSVDRSITITVESPTPTPTPTPADTAGPTITNISASSDKIMWPPYCRPNQVTISAFVHDPSGVSGVKLVYRVVEGERQGYWQAKGMGLVGTDHYSTTIGDKDLALSLNPPLKGNSGTLQYYIEAFDSKGNRSQSATNSLQVLYCVY